MEDLNLSELFAAADSIGNQYQTDEEREELAAQLDAIHQQAQDEGLLVDE